VLRQSLARDSRSSEVEDRPRRRSAAEAGYGHHVERADVACGVYDRAGDPQAAPRSCDRELDGLARSVEAVQGGGCFVADEGTRTEGQQADLQPAVPGVS
jgi:hypothetical protein